MEQINSHLGRIASANFCKVHYCRKSSRQPMTCRFMQSHVGLDEHIPLSLSWYLLWPSDKSIDELEEHSSYFYGDHRSQFAQWPASFLSKPIWLLPLPLLSASCVSAQFGLQPPMQNIIPSDRLLDSITGRDYCRHCYHCRGMLQWGNLDRCS